VYTRGKQLNSVTFAHDSLSRALNIVSEKQDGITNVIDSLNFDFIKAIPEDDNFGGGIKDFGKFDEGSCLKIDAKISDKPFAPSAATFQVDTGLSMTWVICLDNDLQKNNLMNMLIKLKLKRQHQKGIYIETTPPKDAEDVGEDEGADDKTVVGPKGPKDGYWILLQDWSQCTLKCGGGLQYQQLMCSPPKTGGKPCEGPPIRTRPCNEDPCPEVLDHPKETSPLEAAQNNYTLSPIVKMMSISNRPQRYDKCHLKEGDVLYEKRDDSTKSMAILPRLPARLVMNDKSISLYQDDTMTNKIATFLLVEVVLTRVIGSPNCFKIKSTLTEQLICQLEAPRHGDFVEEWDYDFNLFKNQCYKKRARSSNMLKAEEDKLEKKFTDQVNSLKLDIVSQKAEVIKKEIEKDEEVKLTSKVETARTTSMMAIQKESKLEELLEKRRINKRRK